MIDGIERGSGLISKYKGRSLDTTEAAYGGVLIFNPDNNASIFFPAAGRRWHTDGSLEYASETGYYWSSSAAPGWTDTSSGEEKGSAHGNIWGIEYTLFSDNPKSRVINLVLHRCERMRIISMLAIGFWALLSLLMLSPREHEICFCLNR